MGTMLRRLVILPLIFAGVLIADAQITVPFEFKAGTVISPDQVNANFARFGTALNRTNGIMTGPLTTQAITASGTIQSPTLAGTVVFVGTLGAISGQGGNIAVPAGDTIDGVDISTVHVTNARAYLATNQLIPQGAITRVVLNGVTRDQQARFTNGRYAAPTTGLYQVNACVFIGGNANRIYIELRPSVSGSSYATSAGTPIDTSTCISDLMELVVGETLELWTYHEGTTPLNALASSAANFLSVARIQ